MTKIKLPRDLMLRDFERRTVEVNREIHGTSDRAAALVLAAQLDGLIDSAVRKRLLPRGHGKHPLLDGPTAPIGTFYSKTVFLRESGVISDRLFHDIELVRKIRNRFAHEWSCDSFDDPSIKPLVSKLQVVVSITTPGKMSEGRLRFIVAVLFLLLTLENVRRRSRTPKQPREEPTYGFIERLKHLEIGVAVQAAEDSPTG